MRRVAASVAVLALAAWAAPAWACDYHKTHSVKVEDPFAGSTASTAPTPGAPAPVTDQAATDQAPTDQAATVPTDRKG